MSHERTLNKYHRRTAWSFYGIPRIHLSFLARRGDNIDITGISETLDSRHIGTVEHTAFACTKVILVNLSPQNSKEQY